jgi:hypothetical protein
MEIESASQGPKAGPPQIILRQIYWINHLENHLRYEAMGVKVLRSDRHGAVTFVTDGKDLKVQTFLGSP